MNDRAVRLIRSIGAFLSVFKRRRRLAAVLLLAPPAVAAFLVFCKIPGSPPCSTVLLDRNGTLLNAKIARDGQWRFPQEHGVPARFAEAIVACEDRRFFYHPGVDPLALCRALIADIRGGAFVQGGSTLTMQLIRLQAGGGRRTFARKAMEMAFALRETLVHSKSATLARYASLAPFGGNVVGLRAAAWRYFECDPEHLSWAQTATLAVLPNSPGLVHPGRNRKRLLDKRNRLLETLCRRDNIDSLTLTLALAEPLPAAPHPLPSLAPHLLGRLMNDPLHAKRAGTTIITTIDRSLQARAIDIVERHGRRLARNYIGNAAALIAETGSGAARAYVGNVSAAAGSRRNQGNDVDIITAPRSTGSILKPFLYGCMLEDGLLLPQQLVADIPTHMGGFSPQNFNRTFEGAVPAYRALARSLNVPSVRMLKEYGVERFHDRLQRAGMTTLTRTPAEYGMSLILGGAETTLWDIAGMYASLGRTINGYSRNLPRDTNLYHPLACLPPRASRRVPDQGSLPVIGPGAAWLTVQALLDVTRPEEEGAWFEHASGRRIAWKTGTSFGNRDGWAVGVTPGYVIAVWVGNASGEGRAGLTGAACAAPLLFDLLNLLPREPWFNLPEGDLRRTAVCRHSGMRLSGNCADRCTTLIPEAGLTTMGCTYCRVIHLDPSEAFRVTSDCMPVHRMKTLSRFILPPSMEWFYKRKNNDYRELPPWHPACANSAIDPSRSFSIIYPQDGSTVYIPVELTGRRGSVVFQAATRSREATLFWHIDDRYIGATQHIHAIESAAAPGEHLLTVVGESGEERKHRFTVMGK